MAPRLLLTGAKGSFGQDFSAFLSEKMPERFQLLACSRQDFDLADSPTLLKQRLDALAPDLIVNAGAFTQVDAAESNHEAADAANVSGPSVLAEWVAQKAGRYLIHISTDYVFDGLQTNGAFYQPSDATAPVNHYGLSKLKGEEAVLYAAAPQTLVLRTSWLFGSQARGFVSFIQKSLEAGQPANIADDQTGTPTWTGHLCEMVIHALQERPTGILHGCNAGQTTRYEQALWIADCLKLSPEHFKKVSTASLNLPAQRPPNTAMASSFSFAADWREATAQAFARRENAYHV